MIGKQGVQLDGVFPNGSAVTSSLDGEVDPDWMVTPDSANLSLSVDILFPWLKYDASLCGTPPNSLAGNQLSIKPAFVKLTLAQTTQYLIVQISHLSLFPPFSRPLAFQPSRHYLAPTLVSRLFFHKHAWLFGVEMLPKGRYPPEFDLKCEWPGQCGIRRTRRGSLLTRKS